ncbi:MAG: hypothetical protein IKQ41_08155 [Clostridia bacterium]|nr:hypothetical protein [Clostridia bacterium]
MILPAARMRMWMMAALPLTALTGAFWHAGGAAAGMALWMALGVKAIKKAPPLYPKQRRLGASRLFFACAAGGAALLGLSFLASRLPDASARFPDQALLHAGCACFSLIACEKALSRPLSRRFAWRAGGALCALLLFLLFVQ